MVIRNEELLRTLAPAVFTSTPEEGRVSERYAFLPTTDIIEILQDEGWTAWKAHQVRPRTWSQLHAKHIVRLRHEDLNVADFGVGDSFPEMLLINAHNGSGGYTLQGGIFRMVCSNGMVISEADFGKIRIRHIGFKPEQVKEASRRLVRNSSRISDKIGHWKGIEMSPHSRANFFADAASLRFDAPDIRTRRAIATPRRVEDRKTDLWTTFNVAQENVLRGGFRNGARRTVRAISNIQKDVELNSKLWDLASAYSRGL